MSGPAERLYALLPAVYRVRDAEQGGPLRALLGVIEEELRLVEQNIEDLYESWFVETAPEWVIPYLGALVGNTPLTDVVHSRRADVAKTIYYRRRKGTLPMLEELARDVTGWGAHAVEFMELLSWTQQLNHLRYSVAPDRSGRHPTALDRVGTLNLRSADALDRLDGPFDLAAHTVDVRRASPGAYITGAKPQARVSEGYYGTRKIGFFLWRLNAYPLADMPARRADPPNAHGWHFSPLGAPTPLFTNTRAERDPARLAREIHVPGPIRAIAFREDIETHRALALGLPPDQRPLNSTWYGPDRSLSIVANGQAVPPQDVLCKDLSAWARPPAGRIAVDVRRGRISFAAGEEPDDVRVSFAYGFSADIGGGPYDRRGSTAAVIAGIRNLAQGFTPWLQSVRKGTSVDTLQTALTLWQNAGRPLGIIEIHDSAVYGGSVAIDLPADGWLAIIAAPGQLPSVRLIGDLHVSAPDEGGRLSLNGLLIEGGLALDGKVSLDVAHCTIVPGRMLTDDGDPWFVDRDSIVVAGPGMTPHVTIESSITGPIRLPAAAQRLILRDSIVQSFAVGGSPRPAIAATDPADMPGPPCTLERVTVFGAVFCRELYASEVLFTQPVTTQRKQAGCVRFSYVPAGSVTPRRFRCQPDLAVEGVIDPAEIARIRARMTPTFTDTRFGRPGYAQLRLATALEIRTGAEIGAEMGAFASLMQPQRENNLRIRLEEYLPFGLEAALIYVT
jgi:hypothetical protein